MNYLLDTHILLWTLVDPDKVPRPMRRIVEDMGNRVWFSAASIWEIAIKHSLAQADFAVEPATIWKVPECDPVKVPDADGAISNFHLALSEVPREKRSPCVVASTACRMA